MHVTLATIPATSRHNAYAVVADVDVSEDVVSDREVVNVTTGERVMSYCDNDHLGAFRALERILRHGDGEVS